MNPGRRHAFAALASGVVVPRMASGQPAWPVRPVKLVVGFPAGTSPDLNARLLADPLAQALGQPVVVDNRAGAAGAIGAEAVARATDDHTFGVIGIAALTIVPHMNPRLPYKPAEFRPVTVIGTSPMLLVASNTVNPRDAADFFRLGREAGARWNYGSLGVGSTAHLGVELLKARTGLEAVHVPFNAAPAVITAMVNGDVQFASLPVGTALAQAQAGRIRAVAVTSASRSILAPDVPSLPEAGVKALDIEIWNAVMAPAGIAPAAHARLATALSAIIRSDEVRARLFAQGWRADGTTPEALARRIRDESAAFGEVIRARRLSVAS